jgi:glycerophosphoryl diester phosphodiesterase
MSMLAFDEGVKFINASHQFGINVNVWTVNEVSDIEHLISIGVDSIITDVPDTAIKIRDSLSS